MSKIGLIEEDSTETATLVTSGDICHLAMEIWAFGSNPASKGISAYGGQREHQVHVSYVMAHCRR